MAWGSWNFVLWGAYNGLFLTLDRMFLREALQRSGALVATSATLLIVMFGWAIFRNEQLAHLSPFISALFGLQHGSAAIEIPPEMPLALLTGAVISLVPATRLYPFLVRIYDSRLWLRVLVVVTLVVIFVISLARSFAVPFQPFIYFRF